MKIYGQDLRDIYQKLPWQYQIIVGVAAVFFLFLLIYIPASLLIRAEDKTSAALPLTISPRNSAVIGMSDPALAFNPATKTVWLAYTSQESSPQATGKTQIHVRLAKAQQSDCQSWSAVEGGFTGKSDELIAPDAQSVFRTGQWRVETPSLVYDPEDKGREWKLYAYKYFWPSDPDRALQVAHHYGMIAYKTSPDPEKGWSPEQWLFSPAPNYPPQPYEQMILLHLNRLHKSLQDIVSYSRPSVIVTNGALLMSLSAFTGASTPDRTVMFISRDHGNSWLYIGSPLRLSDVTALGFSNYAGASLIEREGKIYLAAVMGDQAQTGKGTFIFAFDDAEKAKLEQESNGLPRLHQGIPLHGTVNSGFSAYTNACPEILLTAEQDAATGRYSLFKGEVFE